MPIFTAKAGRVFCYMIKTQTSYAEKLRDPRWQKKRLRVMERDGFACRDCSDTKSNLQVHHCFYEKGEPWLTDDRFLMTLCGDCHEARQALEQDAKRALGMIFCNMANQPDDQSLLNFVTSLVKNTESKTVLVLNDEEIQGAIEFGGRSKQQRKASNGMAQS